MQRPGRWSQRAQAYFEAQWAALLERGEAFNPQAGCSGTSADAGLGSRGRIKQSKATNLLKRLREYAADVWRFMREPGVPFTNNLAEQALRMAKVKQKISGCFRTGHGADVLYDSLVPGHDDQAKGQSV